MTLAMYCIVVCRSLRAYSRWMRPMIDLFF